MADYVLPNEMVKGSDFLGALDMVRAQWFEAVEEQDKYVDGALLGNIGHN